MDYLNTAAAKAAPKRFHAQPAPHSAFGSFSDRVDEASNTRYVGDALFPLRTPSLIDFTVFDGSVDGEKCFDRYILNRKAAAKQLREFRKAGMYIERMGDAYYVEPWPAFGSAA